MGTRAFEKEAGYASHVKVCRACTRCAADGLVNHADCKHPSPWANWLGALDARVVIVGQDFSGTKRGYSQPQLTLPTNRNLRDLIHAAGLEPDRDVYLTNAILCSKPGDMSARVSAVWVRNCAPLLRRTIEIVAPQAVVALGAIAWKALGLAFETRLARRCDAVGRPPLALSLGPFIFALNHPGGLGLANRPLAAQMEDWKRLGDWLRARGRDAA